MFEREYTTVAAFHDKLPGPCVLVAKSNDRRPIFEMKVIFAFEVVRIENRITAKYGPRLQVRPAVFQGKVSLDRVYSNDVFGFLQQAEQFILDAAQKDEDERMAWQIKQEMEEANRNKPQQVAGTHRKVGTP